MNVEQIRWELNSVEYSARFCGWWIRKGRTTGRQLDWAFIVIASASKVGYMWN